MEEKKSFNRSRRLQVPLNSSCLAVNTNYELDGKPDIGIYTLIFSNDILLRLFVCIHDAMILRK